MERNGCSCTTITPKKGASGHVYGYSKRTILWKDDRKCLVRFSDMVIIGEQIEDSLKSGKIQGAPSGQFSTNKFYNFNPKKKDGDANVVMGLIKYPKLMCLTTHICIW